MQAGPRCAHDAGVMADMPTRVRAASGVAHSLAGIGGDEELPASITDDGGTLACEGTLHVYNKFRFNQCATYSHSPD